MKRMEELLQEEWQKARNGSWQEQEMFVSALIKNTGKNYEFHKTLSNFANHFTPDYWDHSIGQHAVSHMHETQKLLTLLGKK